MGHLEEICNYCDALLEIPTTPDFPHALNGLQVQNNGQISKIGAAVDANFSSINKAVEGNINLLLVHHGFFWNFPQTWTGRRYLLYKKIFEANLAIYGAHLPLDKHPVIGNNALLAKALGLKVVGRFANFEGNAIGVVANWGQSLTQLKQSITAVFGKAFHAIEFGAENPQRVGILTGSGGNQVFQEMKKEGIDTLITGEIRYSACSIAQEEKVNLYACGHYATETFGVKGLANLVSEKFSIPWSFIDVPFAL